MIEKIKQLEITGREKKLLLVTLFILLPLFFFRFIILPINEYQEHLVQRNLALEEKINRIEKLGETVRFYEKNILRQRHQGFLNRRVDRILAGLKLKQKADLMTENTVEAGQKMMLKVRNMTLTEVTQLTYQLENAKPVILIESMEILPSFKNNKRLQASYVLRSR